MKEKFTTKIISTIAITLICVVSLIGILGLSSCGQFGIGGNSDVEKAAETAYFGELNSVVKQFNSALYDFQADVNNQNLDGMKEKVDNAQKLIDQLNDLDVPKSCEEIQKAYLDGFVQMQQAFSNYVSIFSDYVGGQYDANALNEQLSSAQKSYSEGMALIKQADKLAYEKTSN